MGLRVLRLNAIPIAAFFTDGFHAFTISKGTGLPIDSKVMRVGYDELGNINVVLEHASFPELKDGDQLAPQNFIEPQFYDHIADAPKR